MPKTPKCKGCGEEGHYKISCRTTARKPIKTTPKPLKAKKVVVKKPKTKSRSYYVRKLDQVFSQYIRLSQSVNGIGTCVTCGTQKPWKDMQNGHFYSRGRYGTRWDETNCHIQDPACNVFLKGNYINYTRYMIDKYGRDYVDELEVKSKTLVKIKTFELQELIGVYTKKVADLT